MNAECGMRMRSILGFMPFFRIPHSAFLLLLAGACSSTPPPGAAGGIRVPHLEFVPESETYAAAVGEYERIWATDASRIARTMQDVSGLSFTDTAITAIVFEGVSSSGFRDTPMRLRASYPVDTKKATLIHELGHRLQSPLFRRQDEEHGPLFLWLYDVWVALYGKSSPTPRCWSRSVAAVPTRAPGMRHLHSRLACAPSGGKRSSRIRERGDRQETNAQCGT